MTSSQTRENLLGELSPRKRAAKSGERKERYFWRIDSASMSLNAFQLSLLNSLECIALVRAAICCLQDCDLDWTGVVLCSQRAVFRRAL